MESAHGRLKGQSLQNMDTSQTEKAGSQSEPAFSVCMLEPDYEGSPLSWS